MKTTYYQYVPIGLANLSSVIASEAKQHVIASEAKQHVIASEAKQHVIASEAKQSDPPDGSSRAMLCIGLLRRPPQADSSQ